MPGRQPSRADRTPAPRHCPARRMATVRETMAWARSAARSCSVRLPISAPTTPAKVFLEPHDVHQHHAGRDGRDDRGAAVVPPVEPDRATGVGRFHGQRGGRHHVLGAEAHPQPVAGRCDHRGHAGRDRDETAAVGAAKHEGDAPAHADRGRSRHHPDPDVRRGADRRGARTELRARASRGEKNRREPYPAPPVSHGNCRT